MKMSKWTGLILLILTLSASKVHAQANSIVAIRAGRLFDSKSGKVFSNQVILVKDDKIAAVGSPEAIQIPPDAQLIDLSKATVLPGLIDGHTHVFGFGLDGIKSGGPPFASAINDTREYRTLLAMANAQKDLRAGFTTLRDLMSHGGGYADVDIKKAIDRGYFAGPRMQVSTMGLVATGEGILGSSEVNLPRNYQTADGPWALIQAVREQIHYGADWIKFHSTADYEFEENGELNSDPTFTKEEVKAIVKEAHRHGRKAACHAFGGEGLRSCVEARADTIEHAVELDEATADLIKKKRNLLGAHGVPLFAQRLRGAGRQVHRRKIQPRSVAGKERSTGHFTRPEDLVRQRSRPLSSWDASSGIYLSGEIRNVAEPGDSIRNNRRCGNDGLARQDWLDREGQVRGYHRRFRRSAAGHHRIAESEICDERWPGDS